MNAISKFLEIALRPRLPAILAVVFAIVFFAPFPADSLIYHLPFSARFWNLPNFPEMFGYLEPRYQGFPMLWRLLLGPGLALNHPRLFIIPNLLALTILCHCCRRLLAIRWALTLCCCLCFPVALFGFLTSLQDFFVNILTTAAAVCLLTPRNDPQETYAESEGMDGWDLMGLGMLAVVANTKTQGLLTASTIIFVAFLIRLLVPWVNNLRLGSHRSKKIRRSEPANKIAAAMLALLLIIAQPVKNVVNFSNPFYPVQAFGLPGTEKTYKTEIDYIPKIPIAYNIFSFLSSALEVDPIIRSEAGFGFKRSWHNHNLPKHEYKINNDDYGYPWITTGGSNGALYLILLAGAIIGCLPRSSNLGCISMRLLTANRRLLLLVLIMTLLPQSLELRYYMIMLFIPALVAVNGIYPRLRHLMRWTAVISLWILISSNFLSPVYFWMRTGSWSTISMSPDIYRELPTPAECMQAGIFKKDAAFDKLPSIKFKDGQLAFSCQLRLGPQAKIDYAP